MDRYGQIQQRWTAQLKGDLGGQTLVVDVFFWMGQTVVKSTIANRQSLCMELTILETLLVSQRTFRSLQQLKVD
jgi:hypothetical protein